MLCLSDLVDPSLPNKFPKIRQHETEFAIQSLTDKTSVVRKNAIQLLCRLLETHPYGAIFGGTLNLDLWQEKYERICQELEVLDMKEMQNAKRNAGEDQEDDETQEESSRNDGEAADNTPSSRSRRTGNVPDLDAIAKEQMAAVKDGQAIRHLRMTKKYFADAISFIKLIQSGVPALSELLVSTSKAEVLESMQFFRVAHIYELPSAEVRGSLDFQMLITELTPKRFAQIGIKKMVHLIWTKDNNTTEEGTELRGVRSSLLDVYRSLYFDASPDESPKENVNRITKNMIEYVYYTSSRF
jgi:condensin complex subunit 1